MAVITVQDDDPWLVARWAFDKVLAAAIDEVQGSPPLIQELESARALDGLSFSLVNPHEARELAIAIYRAAERVSVEERPKTDSLSQSYVRALKELRNQLDARFHLPE